MSCFSKGNVLSLHLCRLLLFMVWWMLASVSALYRNEEEREEWLERLHHEERDHIYRSLEEGEDLVNIIVHFRHNCPSQPNHHYSHTTGQPMTVPIAEYEYMYWNKEELCILVIELDATATEASFVAGAGDQDTSSYDLANTEYETWGLKDLLGNFPLDKPDSYFASRDRVKVCIIDSGVQADHPDFPWGNMSHPHINGTEFDVGTDKWYSTSNGGWHGTHVTGCMCATAGNNMGTVGIVPDCAKYLDVYQARVFTNSYGATTLMSNVDDAIEWCAEQDSHIISLSLSAPKGSFNTELIIESIRNTTLVISAAGNGGSEAGYSYPAHYPSVMSVGSIGPEYLVSSFSQKGADVLAMGESILAPSTANGIENGQSQGHQVDPIIFSPMADDPVTGPICDAGCADGIFACPQTQSICLFDRCTGSGIPVTDQVDYAQQANCAGCVVSADSPQTLYSEGPDFGFQGSIPCVYMDPISAEGLKASAASSGGNVAVLSSTYPNYKFAEGTSQATPFVSGVAALLMHERPGCSPAQIRQAIENSARDLGGDPEFYGNGFVQAGLALDLLALEPAPCGGFTSAPTDSPTTSHPTDQPSHSPTKSPTSSPTRSPSLRPTENPSMSPTSQPTLEPTEDLGGGSGGGSINSATPPPTQEPTPMVFTRRNPNTSGGFNFRWGGGSSYYRNRGHSGNY